MWIQVRPPLPQSSYPASAGFMDIKWNKVGQSMPGAKATRAGVMPRVGKTDGASLLTTPQTFTYICKAVSTPSILNWLGLTRTFVDSAPSEPPVLRRIFSCCAVPLTKPTTLQEVGQGCLPMAGLESGQAMSGPGYGSETHHSPCHFVEMASQIPTIDGKT